MTRRLWYALPFAVVVALVLGRAAYALVFGSSVGAPLPLSLHPDHSAVSVPAGGHFPIGVRVLYHGTTPVSFRADGLPQRMSIRTYSTTQPYGSFDTIDIAVSQFVPPGTYPLTVVGTAGRSVARFPVTVVVKPYGAFTLRLAPPERRAGIPGAANFLITLDGHRVLPGPKVSLAIRGLPSGSHASFSSPVVTAARSSTLHVTFARTTKPGVYRIMLVGTAGRTTSVSYAYLVLYVVPPTRGSEPNFTVAGSTQNPLYPGAKGPLDLAITNVAGATLNVTSLTVQLTGTNKPACAVSNYTVQQYSGPYPLQVPANSTRTLAQLGVPQAQWPSVTMLDLPVNQDACKSTVATLVYAGLGSGQ